MILELDVLFTHVFRDMFHDFMMNHMNHDVDMIFCIICDAMRCFVRGRDVETWAVASIWQRCWSWCRFAVSPWSPECVAFLPLDRPLRFKVSQNDQ